MGVESVCKINVIVAKKEMRVKEAVQLLRDNDVGCLVVTVLKDHKVIPVGIVTDRDIALSMSSSRSTTERPISQIMMPMPVTIKKTDGIYDAVKRMNEFGVKRLPVVDDDGALFGIVCADDLLLLMADEISNLAGIIETRISNNRAPRTYSGLQVY